MGKRITYKKNEQIGKCIYLEELPHVVYKNSIKRKALFKCRCGDIFNALISDVKSEKTSSCSCVKRETTKERNTSHGLFLNDSFPDGYSIWRNIKQRCTNSNNNGYHNYGGRGIKIAEYWVNNPLNFIMYIKTLDGYGEDNLTLDRIDNNGNYERGNLRWATAKTQRNNQRNFSKPLHLTSISGNFIGYFESAKEASIKTGINISTIRKYLLISDDFEGVKFNYLG